MGSAFGWLDYSEYERRKALDVISLFKDQDTVDELGLGVIRDSFADRFFPGTSTIQTRARYFLFIPWMYRDLERRRTESSIVAARARRHEIKLIDALAQGSEQGVIGIQARSTLQRLASNVYWRGLAEWGILQFPGSQPQYHRSLDRFYTASLSPRADGDEPVANGRRNWHGNLPLPPVGFPEVADLRLRQNESEYLRERVLASHPRSLLAFLLDREVIAEADFPWDVPEVASFEVNLELEHARCFSEVMHGAALLYNLMLSELIENPELVTSYRDWLEEWAGRIEASQARFKAWNRDEFWNLLAGARVAPRTRAFVDAWVTLAIAGDAASIVQNDAAHRLIRHREQQLKHGRARLNNSKARGLWKGASGTAQLDYRWRIAKTIIRDIVSGLQSDA